MTATNDTRKLLELAAKAAGPGVWLEHDDRPWSPLTDDGDSRRLQLACLLDMQLHRDAVAVLHYDGNLNIQSWSESYSDHDGDIAAASRMAVLRAAAAIGESMP